MGRKKDNQEMVMYVLVALAIFGLVFTIYNTFFKTTTSSNTISTSSSDCGDLNDLSNVQHLSHHPNIYAECIKKVGDKMFLDAVGMTKEQYMKQNNIQ